MAYKEIPLTRGFVTIVDESDYEWLNQWKWRVATVRQKAYAVRWNEERGKILESMHRVITNCPQGLMVDHINGDTLDNRRENLRNCTNSQNLMNKAKKRTSPYKYKGIWWDKWRKRWRTGIKVDGKMKYLGYFKTEIEAALAYNVAAMRYFGDFAKLN